MCNPNESWEDTPQIITLAFEEGGSIEMPLTPEGVAEAVQKFPPFMGAPLKEVFQDSELLANRNLCFICVCLDSYLIDLGKKKVETSDENWDYFEDVFEHAAELYREALMTQAYEYVQGIDGLSQDFNVGSDLLRLHREMQEMESHEGNRGLIEILYRTIAANADLDPANIMDEQQKIMFQMQPCPKNRLN